MCGKNAKARIHSPSRLGSPPRVREKPSNLIECRWSRGITPACAGKTYFKLMPESRAWDHPRVCGKNFVSWHRESLIAGSPPRVREKLVQTLAPILQSRITPACAGKTRVREQAARVLQDHPRVCGKNFFDHSIEQPAPGSPPRVREKHGFGGGLIRGSGITPACAGKTSRILQQQSFDQDHPRVCGKNAIVAPFFACAPGSPPRVREKLMFCFG